MIPNQTRSAASKESRAYRSGWQSGRFDLSEGPAELPDEPSERELAAYHRGRREGRRIRNLLHPNETF